MIIETSANQLFRVRECSPPADHVWIGSEVKRSKGAFVPKAKARDILVRKAATRLVCAEG